MLARLMGDQGSAKRRTAPGPGASRNEDPPSAGKRDAAPGGAGPRNVRPRGEGAGETGAGAETVSRCGAAERVEAQIATDQEGSVKRAQLLAAGVSRHVVDRLVRSGFLYRRHQGVYIVGHLALAPMANEAAALLACGDGAVISRRSAAHLWGLLEQRPLEVDVTLVGRRCRPKQGLRIRTVAKLYSQDIRRKGGIALTSPARTIVDLAAEVSDIELERLVAEARVRRLLQGDELERAVRRAGAAKGTARVKAFLRSEAGAAMTRSEIERRCRRLLQAAGLPQPKTNCRLAGYEVDFLWPDQRVVLEVDTFGFHGHRRAFERDRRKTMALEDAGYQVIRVTRRQLAEEPYWVIAHIGRALDRRARQAR